LKLLIKIVVKNQPLLEDAIFNIAQISYLNLKKNTIKAKTDKEKRTARITAAIFPTLLEAGTGVLSSENTAIFQISACMCFQKLNLLLFYEIHKPQSTTLNRLIDACTFLIHTCLPHIFFVHIRVRQKLCSRRDQYWIFQGWIKAFFEGGPAVVKYQLTNSQLGEKRFSTKDLIRKYQISPQGGDECPLSLFRRPCRHPYTCPHYS